MPQLVHAQQFDLGDGWTADLASGTAVNVGTGDRRALTPDEMSSYQQAWNSGAGGRATADSQVKSGGLGDLFHSILKAAPLAITTMGFGGGLAGLLGDGASAGAAGGAFDMGGMGSATSLFTGSGTAAGAAGATGSGLLDGSAGSFDTSGMPSYTSPSTGATGMADGVDEFGNFDQGAGTTGTDASGPTTAQAAASGGQGFPDWYNSAIQPGANGSPSLFSQLPTGAQSFLKTLLGNGAANAITGSGSGSSGSNGYSFPFGNVLGGLLEAYGQNQNTNNLKSALTQSLQYADPFHDQRPAYQQQLQQLTTDPSNFFADPAIKATMDFSNQSTGRALAAQGYNMSGNFANDVTQAGMRTAFSNYLPYTDQIASYAGAKSGPGASGQIASNLGTAIAGSNQATTAGLGSAANSAVSGSQPTYLAQLFGTSANQTLPQLFGSMLS